MGEADVLVELVWASVWGEREGGEGVADDRVKDRPVALGEVLGPGLLVCGSARGHACEGNQLVT